MNLLKVILFAVGVIILDLAVYPVLGMLLMNYDDFYDESEGRILEFGQYDNVRKAYASD